MEELIKAFVQLQSVEEQSSRLNDLMEGENGKFDRDIVSQEVTQNRVQKEMLLNEQELSTVIAGIHAQSQVEKTLEEFDKYKAIKLDIIEIQSKVLDRQKQIQVKQRFHQERDAKS